MNTYKSATIAGLLVAATGIGVQALAGVSMPIVPPGLVMLIIGAVVVASVGKRWAPAVGVAAALFELAGSVAVGVAGSAVDLTALGEFAGIWMRIAGCVVAIVAGVLAMRRTKVVPA